MAKYTCCFKPKIYCNINQKLTKQVTFIQQRRIQNPFKRLSNEVTSLEVIIFAKSSALDVWQGSKYVLAQWTIKTIKPHKAKAQHDNFKARYISVVNHWKNFETAVKRNQITYLQSYLFHTIQHLLSLPTISLFTISSIWCTYFPASWNSQFFFYNFIRLATVFLFNVILWKRETKSFNSAIIVLRNVIKQVVLTN